MTLPHLFVLLAEIWIGVDIIIESLDAFPDQFGHLSGFACLLIFCQNPLLCSEGVSCIAHCKHLQSEYDMKFLTVEPMPSFLHRDALSFAEVGSSLSWVKRGRPGV